ncbi:helix-turn-helix domain-containing protein [Tabrizicola oligotrophica]|uniref:Helix-turn-helix transcriptional regulator n=1 Tax=Tabrizicola oligotrophica TaxID=2710650 RepID=A0A6M0QSX7_9RHOB|nr:helix-turn-helix domain-containing protein [Tabrizicola oligotrophica]NEY90121.1 helix-turn-helix transcriptional regulator [Tabrizicola oligotrophica]
MDDVSNNWYFSAMVTAKIPSWQLYGEQSPFPDLIHIETITDRAAGLDWQIAPHRHVHLHQVFLVLSGEVRLTIDGRAQRGVPPLLMNMPRGHVHGFGFAAGTQGYVLTLPAADFPELFRPEAETRAALERPFVAAAGGMEPLFQDIARLHAAPDPLRRLKLRAAALALCCAVAEAGGERPDRSEGDARIARFEELIRAHLADGWQLADYAGALAVSERHLRRLCLAGTGLSAHGFLEATRLREACRLLAYTRMRAQEVGFALGFDDPAYFARAFRRGMGMSASDYRRRLEGDDG